MNHDLNLSGFVISQENEVLYFSIIYHIDLKSFSYNINHKCIHFENNDFYIWNKKLSKKSNYEKAFKAFSDLYGGVFWIVKSTNPSLETLANYPQLSFTQWWNTYIVQPKWNVM